VRRSSLIGVSGINEFGQPVGDDVSWVPGPELVPVTLTGRSCRLEPLDEHHVDGLYAALCVDSPPTIWTYMPGGPYADRDAFAGSVAGLQATPAMVPMAILLPDGTPVGIATFLRIDHGHGTAEVGYISYSSHLQRTTAATEAMYLMAAYAFEVVGVRRYEWKCDSLNEASRRAAARLGFTFEGIFRQATLYKGRNRDTAWFSITDQEWPRIREAFDRWLDPANFDEQGRQRTPLTTPTEEQT
jgi:RimJ/RimL family protein N-acetyltransferase